MFIQPDYIDNLVVNHPNTLKLHKQPYQICTKSVMDTSDPLIEFDENGVCNHVRFYENWMKTHKLLGKDASDKIDEMVSKMRKEGKGNDYDCIMGLSGGVDSSYMSYLVSKVFGLRALVVHVDTGWNSELAVRNIQNIVQKLNLDLHTLVLDWQEMRDLQLSYFKSGVANQDVPQDHSFIASLYKEAEKFKIKYIMNGGNMATESILPKSWGYEPSDCTNLLSIHKTFGTIKLKTYPTISLYDYLLQYPYLKGMKVIRPLEYIDYNKNKTKEFLKTEFGWSDYGGKHYESKFTKFFQAHYLPLKFGYDKRKAHLSSLVVSGQMSREDAIIELKKPLYDPADLREDIEYFSKKLNISIDEYYEIISQPIREYSHFSNQYNIVLKINKIIKILGKLKKSVL
jgi:N-acetyl sugar amidotransferase